MNDTRNPLAEAIGAGAFRERALSASRDEDGGNKVEGGMLMLMEGASRENPEKKTPRYSSASHELTDFPLNHESNSRSRVSSIHCESIDSRPRHDSAIKEFSEFDTSDNPFANEAVVRLGLENSHVAVDAVGEAEMSELSQLELPSVADLRRKKAESDAEQVSDHVFFATEALEHRDNPVDDLIGRTKADDKDNEMKRLQVKENSTHPNPTSGAARRPHRHY